MFAATDSPCATRYSFTWAMIGPRFRTTSLLTTVSAPLPDPDSTFTMPWCATLLACTHSVSTAGLATAFDTPAATALLTPLTICP